MNQAGKPERRRIAASLMLAMSLALAGCYQSGRDVVPEEIHDEVTVSGLSDIRFWSDEFNGDAEQITAAYASYFRPYNLENNKQINILAISGGGQNGAYAAGLLNGWTKNGSRPKFDLVTGISTGSIIAPMAFLGSRYDAKLREIYTTISEKQLGKADLSRSFAAQGVMDSKRFEELIKRYTSEAMLDEIAGEWRKGRLLLLGTTNLEAERGVIWNITALAASGNPDRLNLFRQIIQASAAIPGAYTPVRIKVEHDGKSYDELHVDGGLAQQVFIYPPQISARALDKHLGYTTKKHVYVIRNGKVTPEYKEVEENTLKVAGRSISMLIKMQGIGNVRQIANIARRDGMSFNLAAIPSSFTKTTDKFFDPGYTVPLYRLGYEAGVNGQWQQEAP